MAEFAPPSGPPPPKVPEGWKAVWNDQYSEWFFVNIYTKKSQWDKPTEPVYPPGEAPEGPPPSYAPSTASGAASDEKSKLGSNNPYASPTPTGGSNATMSEDERLARQLQEEEQARANSSRGAADSFYNQGPSPQPYGQQSPFPQSPSPYGTPVSQDRGGKKGGLLGKLLGKAGGSSHQQQQYGYPQQQGYPPQQYGGGYGQPGYGQPGYGQPQGYYGGQPGYYPQQQQQMMGRGRKGGGMGVGSAAALGVGGGLLGGALLGSAMADDGGDTYVQNNYGDGDMDGDFGDFD